MSAREVIRQIEALPPDEQREVRDYLAKVGMDTSQPVRRMDTDTAAKVSERVFSEHAELFRKLAQ